MPKKIVKGKVVSTKMAKTIVVAVERHRMHPKYKKMIARTKKFKAHDEESKSKVGDIVEIEEHKPISKTKRWILKDIVVRGN